LTVSRDEPTGAVVMSDAETEVSIDGNIEAVEGSVTTGAGDHSGRGNPHSIGRNRRTADDPSAPATSDSTPSGDHDVNVAIEAEGVCKHRVSVSHVCNSCESTPTRKAALRRLFPLRIKADSDPSGCYYATGLRWAFEEVEVHPASYYSGHRGKA